MHSALTFDEPSAPAGTVLTTGSCGRPAVVFPWYYFGGGMKLTVAGVGHRFSFRQPQNTQEWPGIDAIPGGRAAGKAWKAALATAGSRQDDGMMISSATQRATPAG